MCDDNIKELFMKKAKNTNKLLGLIIGGVIVVVAIIAVACFFLLGKGDKSDDKNGDNGNKNTNIEAFEYGQDYINNNLKGDYWLVYNVTHYSGSDSGGVTMEIRKTSKGYFYSADGSDMLFIKNGDKYDQYYQDDDVYTNSGMQWDQDWVESMMAGVTTYMIGYAGYGTSLQKSGTGTIAGRSCDKYTMEYSYPGISYKYKHTYFIDKATGVGLKLTMDAQTGSEKAGYEFEATKFQTTGVSLPAYR